MSIVGVPLVLLGVWLFYMKYRSIIGGTRCKAKIIASLPNRGGDIFVVAFYYEGEHLQKNLFFWNTLFPRRHIGKELYVYYNDKYPSSASCMRVSADVFILFILILGVFLAFVA